ncbi:exodeoxyribonuclease III [Candidatus Hepatobacter penaei]|uniref:exodeoxyribonuclease III n=1 Tax=Candidatus Hepatobacter penaei TaxID=1274402 RepID=UPI0004F2B34B|nr:exodeoxyribonuclease III [Candidatus Hepatobacter penaei]
MTTTLNIATWNVNSVRARLPLLLTWLKEAKPDVVLLQETKVEDLSFPASYVEELGYNLCVHGQKSYNGVAILSTSPLEDVTCGLVDFESVIDAQGDGAAAKCRYIEAFTAGVRVISVYAPNGQDLDHPRFLMKKAFYQALEARLVHLLQGPDEVIVGGDFNIAPFESDVYDASLWSNRILCSDEERAWFRRLLNRGFYDPLQASVTKDQTNPFTWWDYRTRGFEEDRGLRIDHLLLSPGVAQRALSAHVDRHTRGWEKPSDHAPVVGVLAAA